MCAVVPEKERRKVSKKCYIAVSRRNQSMSREDARFMKATGRSRFVEGKYLFLFCRYYLATSERESAVQHLYRVSLLDPGHRSARCLTCNIVRERDGSRCLYNSAKFSTDNSHYVLTCAGPGVPDISIYNKVRIYNLPYTFMLSHSSFYHPRTSKDFILKFPNLKKIFQKERF